MTSEHKERFLLLLQPVYPRLSRYALAMTRNHEEAEDLVSDAVIVALEKFDTIRDDAGFAGFLFRIVSRTHKRSRYRERMRLPFTSLLAESVVDAGTSPERSTDAALIIAALNTLPPKMKESLLLFDLADLSLEEIQGIQGGSLSGVKSRIARGHERLRAHLELDQADAVSRTSLERLVLQGGKHYAV